MKNSRLDSDNFSGLLNELRVASAAGGGTGLTTTAQIIGFPGGTSHVSLLARAFTTAVVAKYALNPYLLILSSPDNGVSATDFSSAAQKNPATTGVSLNAMPTLANGGALYIGSHVPFRGFAVTMSASVNAIASVMLVEFWNGVAWVATAGFVDGTTAAGNTLTQTGNVTFTVPTTWAKAQLSQTRNPAPSNPPLNPASLGSLLPYNNQAWYWVRVSVGAALSATVIANTVYALNRSTNYAEVVQDSYLQFRTTNKPNGCSCVEVLTDAGTGKLIVNCYTDNPMGSFQ